MMRRFFASSSTTTTTPVVPSARDDAEDDDEEDEYNDHADDDDAENDQSDHHHEQNGIISSHNNSYRTSDSFHNDQENNNNNNIKKQHSPSSSKNRLVHATSTTTEETTTTTTTSAPPSPTTSTRSATITTTTTSTTITKPPSFYETHCIYLVPMLGWFVASALLSAYNKTVFGDQGKIAFPCPLFLTSFHFAWQWMFSVVATTLFPVATGLPRYQQLSWREWAAVSIPCGMVTAADVGLSNLSMVHISLTFYTMVKASTPVFVLFWAWAFRIERITWSLVGVIAVIAVGEFLTVVGETQFVWIGFFQCLAASILSGARWTLVQLQLQSLDPPLATSIVTMRVLAPSMFVSMLVVSVWHEEPWQHLHANQVGFVVVLGTIGAAAAIAMVLCEFMLILRASAIVLMIGGVVKELLNIGIGMTFFGDTLNLINAIGFCIVFAGVILYKVTFHGGGHHGSATTSGGQHQAVPSSDSNSPSTQHPADENGGGYKPTMTIMTRSDSEIRAKCSDDEGLPGIQIADGGDHAICITPSRRPRRLRLGNQAGGAGGGGGGGVGLGLRRPIRRQQHKHMPLSTQDVDDTVDTRKATAMLKAHGSDDALNEIVHCEKYHDGKDVDAEVVEYNIDNHGQEDDGLVVVDLEQDGIMKVTGTVKNRAAAAAAHHHVTDVAGGGGGGPPEESNDIRTIT